MLALEHTLVWGTDFLSLQSPRLGPRPLGSTGRCGFGLIASVQAPSPGLRLSLGHRFLPPGLSRCLGPAPGGGLTSGQLRGAARLPARGHVRLPQSLGAHLPQPQVRGVAHGAAVGLEGVELHPELGAHGQHGQRGAHRGQQQHQLHLPLLLRRQPRKALSAPPPPGLGPPPVLLLH